MAHRAGYATASRPVRRLQRSMPLGLSPASAKLDLGKTRQTAVLLPAGIAAT